MTLHDAKQQLNKFLEWYYSDKVMENPQNEQMRLAIKYVIHFISLFENNLLQTDIPLQEIYNDIYKDKQQLLINYTKYLIENDIKISPHSIENYPYLFLNFTDFKLTNQ